MRVAACLLATLLATACAGATSSGPFDCLSAPPEERGSSSPVSMVLAPHPVRAGAVATLALGVDPPAAADAYMVGWGADWQCWDGRTWVSTHLLEQSPSGGGGRIVERSPGVTVTIPAIGYGLPFTFTLTIPDVPPGWYRIHEDFGARDRGESGGYLAVEVAAGP